MRKHQNGFSVVELILVIFFMVILGSVGWTVWKSHSKTTNKVAPINREKQSNDSSVVSFTTIETSVYESNKQHDNAGYKVDGNRLTIYVGIRTTGGYGYKIDKITKSSDQLDVYATESRPGKHCVVTQSITYPQVTVELKQTIPEKIVIHNSIKTNDC